MKKLIHEKVAKALIVDDKNQVLILFRSGTHPRFAHQPDLPGGIVEGGGENCLSAVRREINEELNLDIPAKNFAKLYENTRHTEYPDITYDDLDTLYQVRIHEFRPEEIHISWEHEKFTIMPLSDFLQMHFPDNLDGYLKNVIGFLHQAKIS